MLHIPRNGRLRDPVNLAQMLDIEARYPKLQLIVAMLAVPIVQRMSAMLLKYLPKPVG